MTIKQLTLFLDDEAARLIERVREKFNPIQFALINSHITLCREDEIEELKTIIENLDNLDFPQFTLDLGELLRFSEGRGVFVNVLDAAGQFADLRMRLLANAIAEPREQNPHITIMHPRNSTCNDLIFEEIKKKQFPKSVQIKKVSLIEQEIGRKWLVKKEFHLNACE